MPAAIANAIYNATGARVRSVPFTPDKVQAALKTDLNKSGRWGTLPVDTAARRAILTAADGIRASRASSPEQLPVTASSNREKVMERNRHLSFCLLSRPHRIRDRRRHAVQRTFVAVDGRRHESVQPAWPVPDLQRRNPAHQLTAATL